MGGSDSSKDPDPSNSNSNSFVSGSGSGAGSSKNRIRNTSNTDVINELTGGDASHYGERMDAKEILTAGKINLIRRGKRRHILLPISGKFPFTML